MMNNFKKKMEEAREKLCKQCLHNEFYQINHRFSKKRCRRGLSPLTTDDKACPYFSKAMIGGSKK